MTVEEGLTTDTASELEESSAAVLRAAKEDVDNLSVAATVEEGIKSSDEDTEVVSAAVEAGEVKEQKITEFKGKVIFKSDEERDRTQHRFGFSEIDLEEYAAKIETRGDQRFASTTSVEQEVEDVSDRVGDMQSMNLFGAPAEVSTRDRTADSVEMQRVISDLMATAAENDPSGSYADFTERKAITMVDPYSDESQFASLKFEDSFKQRASIVIDVHKSTLAGLRKAGKKDKLDFADKERLVQVEELLTRLESVKIVDSPVLLKLYNLYRLQME